MWNRKNQIIIFIRLILVFILFCGALSCISQNSAIVVFYNTENLFDTFDDSLKDDEEYLPTSIKRWTLTKFYQKINNLSKVIIACGKWDAPSIVGLAEVENSYVLKALVNSADLKRYEYNYIHYDSEDERGIDLALIYRPDRLRKLFSKPISCSDELHKTRDILYVKGLLFNKDTIHIFVNHWTSRRTGTESTQVRRMTSAKLLIKTIDSIKYKDGDAKIIVMGDFNDEPQDSSIQELSIGGRLINLVSKEKKQWTYFYKYKFIRRKYLFDQILISEALRENVRNAEVLKEDWMMKEDSKGDISPFSTYKGPRYNGGFSDHLPVYLKIEIQKKD